MVNYVNYGNTLSPMTDDDQSLASSEENPSFLSIISTKSYRRPLVMTCGLSLFEQLGGVNVIIMSATTVLGESGGWVMVMLGGVNVLSAAGTLVFIDCMG